MPFTYTDADRKDLCERALELRYNERMNWEEIAAKLSIARSTLNEWRRSDEWKEFDYKWRKMLRTEVRGELAKMGDEAMATLYELMKTDKSGYVKYMAASKILDLNQVGMEMEETIADQHKELNEFLLKQVKRKEIDTPRVLPGGLLPKSLQEENEAYRERKLAEITEAEYTIISPQETHEVDELALDDEASSEPLTQSDESVLW